MESRLSASLIALFEWLAATSLRQIAHARGRQIHLGEDAMTSQHLLALDAAYANDRRVAVIDTRIDEARTGADFELWLGNASQGWRRYAIQAKKLDVHGRYPNLRHRINQTGVLQLDVLDDYARLNRAMPLYCFYNDRIGLQNNCACSPTPEPAQFGCTLTPSSVVRKALKKRGGCNFDAIHSDPNTLFWRCLVKCGAMPNGMLRPAWLSPTFPCQHPLLPAQLKDWEVRYPMIKTLFSHDSFRLEPPDIAGLFAADTTHYPRWLVVLDFTVPTSIHEKFIPNPCAYRSGS